MAFDDSQRSLSSNLDDDNVTEIPEADRDELKEVRKMSSKDTFRVRMWRYVVTVVLMMTAFAVTFATYTFLQNQEVENFETAVRNMWMLCA
jgi:hypothetical protein